MASIMASVDLHCGSCSNYFSDPRLLPCLHVFCKSCLESIKSMNEGTLTCPSCYKITPTQDISTLPRHLKIEREVNIIKLQESSNEAVCGSCEENNKAEAYCVDCESPICSSCVNSHKKLKMLKNHSITSLDSAKPQTTTVTCNDHPKEVVKYYCSQCSCLICSECMLHHKEHKWLVIEEAAQKEKASFKLTYLPKLEQSMKPLNEATDSVTEAIKHCRTQKETIESELAKAFDSIIAAAESRRDGLLKEVNGTFTAKETQLQLQKEKYEKKSNCLKTTIELATAACNEFSALENLSIQRFIRSASDNVLKELESTSFVVDSDCPRLKHDLPKIEEAISSFGKLSTSCQPSLCNIVNIDPNIPIAISKNNYCRFTLQTRNNKGEELTMGGVDVKATILKASITCDVSDRRNGKYSINFSSSKSGLFKLSVSIDEQEVQGSSYSINVIDYVHSDMTNSFSSSSGHAPQYIALGSISGSLYVTTNSGYVEVYDKVMNKIRVIPKSKLGGNNFRGIAVDEVNGVMFISSSSNNRVIKADLNGDVLATVGAAVTRNSPQIQCPTGLCLTNKGLLLVGDCQNRRVLIFTSDFSFKQSIRCNAQVWGVSIDHYNQVHVGTTHGVEVFKVEPNGSVKIAEYGEGLIEKAGQICFPNFEYCTESYQQSFVTNCVYDGKIFLFNWRTNTVVRSFNTGQNPLGMAINQEGVVYSCCYGDKKIVAHTCTCTY